MPVKEFCLETLEHLDMGKVNEAVRKHLRKCSDDCKDRPMEGKARAVLIQIDLVPAPEDDGVCDRVKSQVTISSKIPHHRTRVYDMALKADGKVVFNPDSPNNVDQQTLYGDDDR